MKFLIDTANLESIRRLNEYLPISGVTTNPSIIKKEGNVDFFNHLREIRSIIGIDADFHVQVTADTFEGMIADAEAIVREVDDRVCIKVPTDMVGLKVMKALKAKGFRVTATAIYTKAQGLLALEAGADFLAPYYNRMENMEIDPEEVIAGLADMIDRYGYKAQLLAASFKNMGQVNKAILAGAQTATMDPDILEKALKMACISDAVNVFRNDWKAIHGDKTIADL